MYFNSFSLHDFGLTGYRIEENRFHSDPGNSQTALQTMTKIEQYLFESRQHNKDGKLRAFAEKIWNQDDLLQYALRIKNKHCKAKTLLYPQIAKIWRRMTLIVELKKLGSRCIADFECRVFKLLELGMYIQTPTESLLRMALHRKCFNLAQRLLVKGANPNFIGPEETALTMLRYAYDNAQMVQALIWAGADVNHIGRDGSNLEAAIKMSNVKAVELLADGQVNLDEGALKAIIQIATKPETTKTVQLIQSLAQKGLVNVALKDIAKANGNARTVAALTCKKIA